MADYLTYTELQNIVGENTVSQDDYNKRIKKASAILDNITDNFYIFNDITKDYKFRVDKFKEALAYQIVYFSELGADTYEGINKAPQTFSIGRTSVSNVSRYNAAGANETKSLVAEDVYIALEGTGLLYRGIRGCPVW
ncbi:hypothetical protein [Muricomes intestini]|jgi:hypothetical protein|uniref:hypothetical protein n=1 Tax=Muricomes intestini TaxID=1796634 RepID=UPI002FDD4E4A